MGEALTASVKDSKTETGSWIQGLEERAGAVVCSQHGTIVKIAKRKVAEKVSGDGLQQF